MIAHCTPYQEPNHAMRVVSRISVLNLSMDHGVSATSWRVIPVVLDAQSVSLACLAGD